MPTAKRSAKAEFIFEQCLRFVKPEERSCHRCRKIIAEPEEPILNPGCDDVNDIASLACDVIPALLGVRCERQSSQNGQNGPRQATMTNVQTQAC